MAAGQEATAGVPAHLIRGPRAHLASGARGTAVAARAAGSPRTAQAGLAVSSWGYLRSLDRAVSDAIRRYPARRPCALKVVGTCRSGPARLQGRGRTAADRATQPP